MSKISIVIPIYRPNIEFLQECLNSCKNQICEEEFEIICVYDGDENEANKYKEFFNDVTYLNMGEHYGIANTLNYAIKQCSGEIILIMNQDDIMLPNRCEYQYNFFLANPDVDILGCGAYFIRENGEIYSQFTPRNRYINLNELKVNCCIVHPTLAIKRESLNKLPYMYEQYYTPCEDYMFYFTCLNHGLKIFNDSEIVLKYRKHENQTSIVNWDNIVKKTKWIKTIGNYNETNLHNELTCIIPFKNENIEVEKTIKSIMATSNASIIVINDGSIDNYDYDRIKRKFPYVKYINHSITKGSHNSINEGVENAITPYCIILDAHMRFYDNDWDKVLVNELKKHPNDIIYLNTRVIHRLDDDLYSNEDGNKKIGSTSGGKIDLSCKDRNFVGRWLYNKKNGNIEITSGMLGATYAFSKEHFNYIEGLKGLKDWGFVEAMLTLKTWMMGGNIYRIHDIAVGHCYRKAFPYKFPIDSTIWNEKYMIELFIDEPDIKQKFYEHFKSRYSSKTKKQIDEITFDNNEFTSVKEKFIRSFKNYIEAFPESLEK